MYQQVNQNGMPLIDFLRQGTALVGKLQAAVFRHSDVVFLPQNAHSPGYAGLGIAQVFSHIHGTDKIAFLSQYQDRFQVHFSGFVYTHILSPNSKSIHVFCGNQADAGAPRVFH